ncbi:MAG TPA: phospholipid carrier-dependent glycosyltransferase [Candidatus Elarobacter sp.]|jgi:dolichyl-phosphate-mannose--protein O-mannosyl transferase
MQTGARLEAVRAAGRTAVNVPLLSILGAGLLIRLLLIGGTGFHNDIASFESWMLTLRDNPTWAFYAKSGFADYPPGYFVVLWGLGKIYAVVNLAIPDHDGSLLRAFVKLPGIAMDTFDAWLIYRIARRYASNGIALVAAAFMALNPAAIYVSAYWGQVDSVSWGIVLLALYLVLRSGDEPEKSGARLAWAWTAFAFSVLIKPQAATIGLLLLAYPFATADPDVRRRRLAATVRGVGCAALLALVISLLFHPAGDVIGWLFGRYIFGSNVYPYTSVNAFNLYALIQHFWIPDAEPLLVPILNIPLGPRSIWGILLVVAATGLIVGRYLQRRDDRALLEGAMLCALAFFVLATRMHERYIYGAFLLAIPLISFGRTGLISSVVLTVTMYANLAYSLWYQTVMEQKIPGVDATDLWPLVSHLCAFANVALFFWLGYRYLGVASEGPDAALLPARAPGQSWVQALVASGRGWFSPREGIAALTRADRLFIGGFVVVAFVVPIINYGWPNERIFDEIYFARAGEEYLRGINQFEWTHPPFTKEIIALSMMLFGGLNGLGNTGFGWRFLNIVIGALEVGLLYAFAKRLTASTTFAALAALMLTFDGFHFVEQRIATGEITISTLILLALYALYRYWLAAQVRVQRRVARPFGLPFWITMAAGLAPAALFSWIVNHNPPRHAAEIASGIAQSNASWTNSDWAGNFSGLTHLVVYYAGSYEFAFLYAMVGVYLIARTIVPRRLPVAGYRASYADGTVVALPVEGARTPPVVQAPPSTFDPPELQVAYERDGSERYATPDGTATFTPSGVMTVDGAETAQPRAARTWLVVMLGALGLLASSKWNGAYDFAVVGAVVLLVSLQRYIGGRALYGNPRGFSVDVIVALMIFVSATIYTISYIPFFLIGHGFPDMIALQFQMFWYHSHGVANATHPYSSAWWQWPIMQIPISYYYHDFRVGAAAQNGAACCVAEILALPNPLVFLLGLVTVPYVGYLAWKERHKGYALLVIAYLMQWLPWARTPRLLFEYHFFPNLALIVLCNAIVIQRLASRWKESTRRQVLIGYSVAVVALFFYFYPVLAGVQVTYNEWYARMWPDNLHIPHTSWIVPPH